MDFVQLRALLEKEPLASAFLARACHRDNRISRSHRLDKEREINGWVVGVADDVKKNPTLLRSATNWLEAHFQFERGEVASIEWLTIFVHALWILYGPFVDSQVVSNQQADDHLKQFIFDTRKKMGEGIAPIRSHSAGKVFVRNPDSDQSRSKKHRRSSVSPSRQPKKKSRKQAHISAYERTGKPRRGRPRKGSMANTRPAISASVAHKGEDLESVPVPVEARLNLHRQDPSCAATSVVEPQDSQVQIGCHGEMGYHTPMFSGRVVQIDPTHTDPSFRRADELCEIPSAPQTCAIVHAVDCHEPVVVLTRSQSQGPAVMSPVMTMQPADLPHSHIILKSPHTPAGQQLPLQMLTAVVKQCLVVKPPIWSKSRQELCESFNWFRSYQGGVYFKDGFVKGYLLSGFAASRDVFAAQGRIIISHGGGKAESLHSKKGQTERHLASDQQAQDKSVRALLQNYKRQKPLVLLVDDKYALFPWNLSASQIAYAVLGFYVIKDAWAEYQPATNASGRVVRYKFAFQWCSNQGPPWWLGEEQRYLLASSAANARGSLLPKHPSSNKLADIGGLRENATKHTRCGTCQMKSPHAYLQGWMCLNPECTSFWLFQNGSSPPDGLDYNDEFLQPESDPPLLFRPEDLFPVNPTCAPKNGITTDETATMGWHCKECGRLSCRSSWDKWECVQCNLIYPVKGAVRKAAEFRALKAPATWRDSSIARCSGIKRKSPSILYDMGGGAMALCEIFILPQSRGQIIHVHGGTPISNKLADAIFEEYQVQASSGALPFRRWPLRSHKLKGPMLTHYFSQNAGVPYQYVGGAENTTSFDEVASAVKNAREFIRLRIRQALNRESEFNEVLSCAYMVKQKMAFHSDAEAGLGPLIAGLSLGAPAMMHFRPHYHHEPDPSKRGIVLSIILRHGDVLIMDGVDVQRYYEHTVIPTNFRIAATARKINIHPPATKSIKLSGCQ